MQQGKNKQCNKQYFLFTLLQDRAEVRESCSVLSCILSALFVIAVYVLEMCYLWTKNNVICMQLLTSKFDLNEFHAATRWGTQHGLEILNKHQKY